VSFVDEDDVEGGTEGEPCTRSDKRGSQVVAHRQNRQRRNLGIGFGLA
jgi:hypothetical protein